MLFDTDVLIWAFRGNPNAQKVIDGAEERAISAVTFMELLQGVRDKREQRAVKLFLSELGFETIPIDEAVSHRATVFMEAYALKSGMGLADALIFATACERGCVLCSGNLKHVRDIPSLSTHAFRP
jgi:predicted nucleic acid-binding protein